MERRRDTDQFVRGCVAFPSGSFEVACKRGCPFAFPCERLASLPCSRFGKLPAPCGVSLRCRCLLCACLKPFDGLTGLGEIALQQPNLPALVSKLLPCLGARRLRSIARRYGLGLQTFEIALRK